MRYACDRGGECDEGGSKLSFERSGKHPPIFPFPRDPPFPEDPRTAFAAVTWYFEPAPFKVAFVYARDLLVIRPFSTVRYRARGEVLHSILN